MWSISVKLVFITCYLLVLLRYAVTISCWWRQTHDEPALLYSWYNEITRKRRSSNSQQFAVRRQLHREMRNVNWNESEIVEKVLSSSPHNSYVIYVHMMVVLLGGGALLVGRRTALYLCVLEQYSKNPLAIHSRHREVIMKLPVASSTYAWNRQQWSLPGSFISWARGSLGAKRKCAK